MKICVWVKACKEQGKKICPDNCKDYILPIKGVEKSGTAVAPMESKE